MLLTPFHAYYRARKLENLKGRDKLVAAFSSSDIEIYPYQIAAAIFALRSPYLKGAILCDDGSLGKSFEALLIITELWYEGKRRMLIIVPTPLLYQWMKIIDSRYSVPVFSIDSNAAFQKQISDGNANPFEQDGVVITTYDFAAEKADFISKIEWDLTTFEEAHHLRRIYTGENKGAVAIHEAVKTSFKLLLTATPMQNDIMDLYGLIYFIDENALPEADSFYKRYFRKPENYPELARRVSKFCFRTTRPQVSTYIKIPERLPMTFDYLPTDEEKRLADMLGAYLARDKKYAFPKMELYDLTLMLNRTLSSSTFALTKTLQGVERRLSDLMADSNNAEIAEEHGFIKSVLAFSESIKENAKGRELHTALKKGFAELKRLGANKKALIFTENRETQKYIYDLLNNGDYKNKTLTFSGEQSRDYTVMEQFENDAEILISTDIAAEGFNLEFCSFVINYDLPYNTLNIEQRISRCHRQGQQSDVLVVNFLNRNNFADVRILELINKRMSQYDGIIGLSGDVIGSFGNDINRDFSKLTDMARPKAEIEKAFKEVLSEHEAENKQLVKSAEESLFTLFNKEISKSVAVSPQYLEQRIQEVNDELWELAKWYFDNFNKESTEPCYEIDESARTFTAIGDPPVLFYYWSGSRNKPYQGMRYYGVAQDFKPARGRITLSSVIGKGILQGLTCAERGTITVDADIEPCTIGLYCVSVWSKDFEGIEYVVFVGMTNSGKILTNNECCDIMERTVISFSEDEKGISHWLREVTGGRPSHELDRLILPEEYIRRAISETDSAIKEEIDRLREHTQDIKAGLERNIQSLRAEVNSFSGGLGRVNSIAEKVLAEKRNAAAQKELKQREQQLFLDGMRLDVELEEQIRRLTDEARLKVDVKQQFIIKVIGR